MRTSDDDEVTYRSPEEVHKFFSEMSRQQLEELWTRLRAASYTRYGRLQKRVRGLDIEELIQDSVADALLGKRRWPVLDKDGNEVTFFTFINQTIRSKVSHRSYQEAKKLSLEELTEKSEAQGIFLKELSVTEDLDWKIRVSQLCSRIYARIQPTPALTAIMDLMIETQGTIKAEEIADHLNLTLPKVHNFLRRLRRIARKVLKES